VCIYTAHARNGASMINSTATATAQHSIIMPATRDDVWDALVKRARFLKVPEDSMYFYAHTTALCNYYVQQKVQPIDVSMGTTDRWPIHKRQHHNGTVVSVKVVAGHASNQDAAYVLRCIEAFRACMRELICPVVECSLFTPAHQEPYIVLEQHWGTSVLRTGADQGEAYAEYVDFLLESVCRCMAAGVMYSDPKLANTTRCPTTQTLVAIDLDSEGLPYGTAMAQTTNYHLAVYAARSDETFVQTYGKPSRKRSVESQVRWYLRRMENNADAQVLVFVSTINHHAVHGPDGQRRPAVEPTSDALERVHALSRCDGSIENAVAVCRRIATAYKGLVAAREQLWCNELPSPQKGSPPPKKSRTC
jgi:hypothetical protein